jgi:hypothetical protein
MESLAGGLHATNWLTLPAVFAIPVLPTCQNEVWGSFSLLSFGYRFLSPQGIWHLGLEALHLILVSSNSHDERN